MIGQGAQIKIEATDQEKAQYLKLAESGQHKPLLVVFFAADE